MSEKLERGYTVCRNGKITKGQTVVGLPSSVSIPVVCPAGSQPRALFHTHPGGSLQLSPQDIKTMREKGLPVCIKAGTRIKCYKPRARR